MDRSLLIKDLVRDEGLELSAYHDSEGYVTIGIGRMIDRRRGGKITKEEAYYLAGHDIDGVERDLDRDLPWWRQMTEARQRALANMCFNLGLPKLLEFKVTLAHLKAGRYVEAAREMMDSKWAKQVGDRAERLAEMIREG